MEQRENFSKKRAAILSVLRGTVTHPTADWVYAQLKPCYPDLSLGTVYRNLKRFCGTGKAASLGAVNGKERFDGCVSPHAHFVCEKCGAVIDVPKEFFAEEELKDISDCTGCRVTSASVMFHGLCKECAAQENS